MTLGSSRKNDGSRPHRLTDANRVDRWLDIAKRVADGKGFCLKANGLTRIPTRASGVDIEINWFVGVVELQEKELGNDQLSDVKAELTLGVSI